MWIYSCVCAEALQWYVPRAPNCWRSEVRREDALRGVRVRSLESFPECGVMMYFRVRVQARDSC